MSGLAAGASSQYHGLGHAEFEMTVRWKWNR